MGWAYSGYIHHVSLHTFYPHWEKSSWSKVSWELDQMKYSPLISSYTFCYPHWEKQVVNQKFHEGFISSYNTNCIHIFLFKILISHIDFQMCDFADVSNTLSCRTFQYIQRELPKVPAHIPVLVLVSNYMSPPLHPLSPCPPLTLLLPPPHPIPTPSLSLSSLLFVLLLLHLLYVVYCQEEVVFVQKDITVLLFPTFSFNFLFHFK